MKDFILVMGALGASFYAGLAHWTPTPKDTKPPAFNLDRKPEPPVVEPQWRHDDEAKALARQQLPKTEKTPPGRDNAKERPVRKATGGTAKGGSISSPPPIPIPPLPKAPSGGKSGGGHGRHK